MSGALFAQIYALVQQVPAGRVTTYGAVAMRLGCTPRTVGFALAALPKESDVPWHRVVNRQGRVSPRLDGYGNLVQEQRLMAEGVAFNRSGQLELERYAWRFGA